MRRETLKTTMSAIAATLAALPALAQTFETAEQARAYELVLPAMLEITSQLEGPAEYMSQILATCTVLTATPAEMAVLATATAVTPEVSGVVNAIGSRPEINDCIKQVAGG